MGLFRGSVGDTFRVGFIMGNYFLHGRLLRGSSMGSIHTKSVVHGI